MAEKIEIEVERKEEQKVWPKEEKALEWKLTSTQKGTLVWVKSPVLEALFPSMAPKGKGAHKVVKIAGEDRLFWLLNIEELGANSALQVHYYVDWSGGYLVDGDSINLLPLLQVGVGEGKEVLMGPAPKTSRERWAGAVEQLMGFLVRNVISPPVLSGSVLIRRAG